eukprot:9865605-Lingulodinium_polyedra.AAC.1
MRVRSVALTATWSDPDCCMDEASVSAMSDESDVVATWASTAAALATTMPKHVEGRAKYVEPCLEGAR